MAKAKGKKKKNDAEHKAKVQEKVNVTDSTYFVGRDLNMAIPFRHNESPIRRSKSQRTK